VFSTNRQILNQLNLLWGVKAFYYDSYASTDNTVEEINQMAKQMNYVHSGDLLVNLLSMPIADRGMVNTLRVSTIEMEK